MECAVDSGLSEMEMAESTSSSGRQRIGDEAINDSDCTSPMRRSRGSRGDDGALVDRSNVMGDRRRSCDPPAVAETALAAVDGSALRPTPRCEDHV